MNIQVYDDLLPVELQDVLEELFFNNCGLPWYFSGELTGKGDSTIRNPGLGTKVVVDGKVFRGLNKAARFAGFVPSALEKRNIIKSRYKVRLCRAFLQLPSGKDGVFADLHTDDPYHDHLVVLYYVNDSEGDTFITNMTNKEVRQEDASSSNYEVVKTITPKKGRVVLFDGSVYHGSSNPTDRPRCVLNYNLTY